MAEGEFIPITSFMVSINEVPARGPARMLVEADWEIRDMINYAAGIAGLSSSKFMRAVLYSAAKKVLEEAGKQYDHSVGSATTGN